MKKSLPFILILSLWVVNSYGQFTYYEIQLKDKNGTSFSLSNPSAYLSHQAISRRLNQRIPIDSSDLPVNASYVDRIIKSGNVIPYSLSKWFNTICIRITDDSQVLEKIRAFPFVVSVKPIVGLSEYNTRRSENKQQDTVSKAVLPVVNTSYFRIASVQGTMGFDYGNSYNQIHIHNGEYLHDMGFHGEGMSIAILDAGFYNYKSNPVFDSLRQQNLILGEYDFVNKENSVNEDNEHGAQCLSLLGANKPGTMVGSSPKAGYYLLRTENIASETMLEEMNWAAAAEYADSAGADILSSSLGYINFDNSAFNHSYGQRDGNTALITKAADMAAKKGILVINSAGNDGAQITDNKFITCPADGDSVLAVGSVDINFNISPFSSWGPNAAGVIKPDVVSLGSKVAVANWNGIIGSGSGTSYACPNLAGLVACLWQAFPGFNNMQIIDAVKKSADKYDRPDERYGYGLPDFKKAYSFLKQAKANLEAQQILSGQSIKIYPVPFTDRFNIIIKAKITAKMSFRLMDMAGKTLVIKTINTIKDEYSTITFQQLDIFSKGVYLVQYWDGENNVSIKLIK